MSNIAEVYTADKPSWKHTYSINILNYGVEFRMGADDLQDVIDAMMNYVATEYPRLIMTLDEEDEIRAQGNIDKYISGGNDGRHLNTLQYIIREM